MSLFIPSIIGWFIFVAFILPMVMDINDVEREISGDIILRAIFSYPVLWLCIGVFVMDKWWNYLGGLIIYFVIARLPDNVRNNGWTSLLALGAFVYIIIFELF